ncbi:MAG: FG-GAP-like repeat-containing protein [Planctomycetota bacterium]
MTNPSFREVFRAVRYPRWVALAAFALAAPTLQGQQFQDQTISRFPSQNEYSSQVAIADVDNDGDLDVCFANGRGFASASLQEQVRLYINNGAGVFADESVARLGTLLGFGRDVEFADVDDDGDLDLMVVNDFNTAPRLMINDGTGHFANESMARLPAMNLGGSHCSFGDVDNDGDLDMWLTNGGSNRFGSGQPQLWTNDGAGFFTNETTSRLPLVGVAQQLDSIFGDIDGDFDLDMVAGNRGSNSKLYENNGSGVFADVTAGRLPPDSNTYAYDFGDLDGDGDLDLVGANSQPGGSQEAIFVNNGAGTFVNQTTTLLPGANNPSIDDNDSKFIDFDNDGDLDFVVAALGGSSERVYRNNGANFTLLAGVITAIADSSLDIELGDLDGDNDLDIVTAQGESGGFQNRIYINSGPADTIPPTFPRLEQIADTLDDVGPYVVRVVIRDSMTSDTNFFFDARALTYTVDGGPDQTAPLRWSGGDVYRAEIPGQPQGSFVEYHATATDFAGNSGASATRSFTILGSPPEFDRSDCNNDASFDVADVVYLLGYLFPAMTANPLACADACDLNDDGSLDVSDPITALGALFPSGPPVTLPAPSGTCGVDPTADGLDCAGIVTGCP